MTIITFIHCFFEYNQHIKGGITVRHKLDELKEQNIKSAKAMSFLIAGIIALLVWGFQLDSLPAFLLAAFFAVTLIAESQVYRKSQTAQQKAEQLEELFSQLTETRSRKQD